MCAMEYYTTILNGINVNYVKMKNYKNEPEIHYFRVAEFCGTFSCLFLVFFYF